MLRNLLIIPAKSLPLNIVPNAQFVQSDCQCQLNCQCSERNGLAFEKIVYDFYLSHHWKLFSHRAQIFDVEIDLVLFKDRRLHLIEVKSLNDEWRVFERLRQDQKNRLTQVLHKIRQNLKWPFPELIINGYMAFVSPVKKINFLSWDDI